MRSTRNILFGCALIAIALIFILRAINRSNTPVPVADAGPTPGAGVTTVAARAARDIAYAAVDIPAGSIVTREMLEMRDNKGGPTQGYVTDINSQAAGFITRVAIPAGSQVRPNEDFIGHISQVGIAGALQPGTRALVLPLPGKPTLHDLVKIGNSVDVLAAFDGQESRTIAQNVRVLAVDVFANDYPQVNAAMRGPYKADPLGRGTASSPAAPGASNAVANAAPDTVEPVEDPTPAPENAPKPDPSLTLEVTPQQAAAIQLALATNAPVDFLVRPALPGNRSGDIALVSDDGTQGGGVTTTSVTKRQIAPYAEAVKNAKNNGGGTSGGTANRASNGGGNSGGTSGGTANRASNGGGNSGGTRTASTRGGGGGNSGPRFPVPDLPPITEVSQPEMPTPFVPPAPIRVPAEFEGGNGGGNGDGGNGKGGGGNNGGSTRLAPAAPSTYQIPIYSDGGVVRTETVPVPQR